MRALVLEHDTSCPLGRLEDVMATSGISAEVAGTGDIRSLGDPRRYDLTIILGSEDSAYDDLVPWVPMELAYTRRSIESDVPVLGICFGAQMLARALGSRVRRAAQPEVGWVSMNRADEADWMAPGPWLTWHQDTFDWPPTATPLAWSDVAPQAFRQGSHLGLQFHPEATAELIEQWVDVDRRKLASHGVDREALLAETRRHDAQAGEAARALFNTYIDQLRQGKSGISNRGPLTHDVAFARRVNPAPVSGDFLMALPGLEPGRDGL